MRKWLFCGLIVLLTMPMVAAQDDDSLIFGMVLVGSKDDSGWSQAHYEGGLYLEEKLGATMLLFENYNQAAISGAPVEVSLKIIVDDLINQGAQVIFLTSESFEEEANTVAVRHPTTPFVQIAGDSVLTGVAPDNLANLMLQIEWAKLIDGCAAALVTETGHIGYLGPLINYETRRLAASAYLGARYCYEHYRNQDPESLVFTVNWLGFWFYIEDVTEDPIALTRQLLAGGADVVLSGIDTPEPVDAIDQARSDNQMVYVAAYNSDALCEVYSSVCIGAPYYHWGPAYETVARSVIDNTWVPEWRWMPPDFEDELASPVGFAIGAAFPDAQRDDLDDFIQHLNDYATNPFVPTSFPLWQGTVKLQDGTVLSENTGYVNILDVWYLPQLLEGMDGESF